MPWGVSQSDGVSQTWTQARATLGEGFQKPHCPVKYTSAVSQNQPISAHVGLGLAVLITGECVVARPWIICSFSACSAGPAMFWRMAQSRAKGRRLSSGSTASFVEPANQEAMPRALAMALLSQLSPSVICSKHRGSDGDAMYTNSFKW